MPLLPSQITLIGASRIIRSTGTGTSPWRRSRIRCLKCAPAIDPEQVQQDSSSHSVERILAAADSSRTSCFVSAQSP